MRVWELARDLGLPVADVRRRLDQLGWPTTSGSAAVPKEAADRLREVVSPLPPVESRSEPKGAYRLLLPYVSSRRRSWVTILVATFASSAAGLLAPWPLKVLADDVLAQRRATGWVASLPFAHQPRAAVAYLAVATLVLFGVASLLEVWLTTLWVRVGNSMVYELAGNVLRSLQRRSVLFHVRTLVGDSMSRVMVDSFGLGGAVNALLFQPLHAIVMVSAMLVLLLKLDVSLALAAVVVAVLMTLASTLIGRAIRRTSRAARDAEAALQAHVHHVLTGVSIVQGFVQERREHLRFRDYVSDVVRARGRSAVLGELNSLGSGLPKAVGTALILWFGVHRVLAHDMTVGTLLVFMTYLGTMTAQVGALAKVYASVQGSRAMVDRVLEVLTPDPDIAEHPRARQLGDVRGHIAFEHVLYSYDGSHLALDDVSFEARPGETVAIVGRSGAGKTTLAALVTRFFDVDSGRVLIDGSDVRDVTIAGLRRQVSMVMQDPFLFATSIRDNIRYGRLEATDEEVEAAARLAGAHEFVTRLPDGYDTVLGERGGTLSGGQRQRVSIARAFLKDAPILVLDEPTSALDAHSERALLAALDRLMAGRTTLVIAHRLSTIRHADRILVLDAGRVVESGSHDELLAARGAYAQMHAIATRRRPQRRPA